MMKDRSHFFSIRNYLLAALLGFLANASAQEIRMVEKTFKKPLYTRGCAFGVGKKPESHGNSHDTEYRKMYLIHSLPAGQPQELSVYFTFRKQAYQTKIFDSLSLKVLKTEFVVNFYNPTLDPDPNSRINETPLRIVLEEQASGAEQVVTLDVSKLDFGTNAFYVEITRLTPSESEQSYYFSPLSYKSDARLGHEIRIDRKDNGNFVPEGMSTYYGLRAALLMGID